MAIITRVEIKETEVFKMSNKDISPRIEDTAVKIDNALKIVYYLTTDMLENRKALFKEQELSLDCDVHRLTSLGFLVQDLLRMVRDELYKIYDDLIDTESR